MDAGQPLPSPPLIPPVPQRGDEPSRALEVPSVASGGIWRKQVCLTVTPELQGPAGAVGSQRGGWAPPGLLRVWHLPKVCALCCSGGWGWAQGPSSCQCWEDRVFPQFSRESPPAVPCPAEPSPRHQDRPGAKKKTPKKFKIFPINIINWNPQSCPQPLCLRATVPAVSPVPSSEQAALPRRGRSHMPWCPAEL